MTSASVGREKEGSNLVERPTFGNKLGSPRSLASKIWSSILMRG